MPAVVSGARRQTGAVRGLVLTGVYGTGKSTLAEVIEVGRLRLDAIHNPGHTPGSISFHVRDTPLLFSGDTLFPGGPGNTSFPDADFATIIRSIEERLFTFPDETIVLPGHGVDTTIGTERPHLDEWIARGW